MIIMQEEYLTVKEVAKALRLSDDVIFRLLNKGDLPGYKIEGSWRISKVDFEEFMEKRRNTPRKKPKGKD